MSKLFEPMNPAQIAEVIKAIKPGDNFKIQFKETEIGDVAYLMGMHNNGFLTVSDPVMMMAIVSSQAWGAPANRIFEVKANNGWDVNWFSGRIQRRIEAIEIIKSE